MIVAFKMGMDKKTKKGDNMSKSNKIDPCYCCKKVWSKDQADKFVVAEGKTVCRDHAGVEKWYAELYKSKK